MIPRVNVAVAALSVAVRNIVVKITPSVTCNTAATFSRMKSQFATR